MSSDWRMIFSPGTARKYLDFAVEVTLEQFTTEDAPHLGGFAIGASFLYPRLPSAVLPL